MENFKSRKRRSQEARGKSFQVGFFYILSSWQYFPLKKLQPLYAGKHSRKKWEFLAIWAVLSQGTGHRQSRKFPAEMLYHEESTKPWHKSVQSCLMGDSITL